MKESLGWSSLVLLNKAGGFAGSISGEEGTEHLARERVMAVEAGLTVVEIFSPDPITITGAVLYPTKEKV